jgi:hypothetical protein
VFGGDVELVIAAGAFIGWRIYTVFFSGFGWRVESGSKFIQNRHFFFVACPIRRGLFNLFNWID